MTALKCLQALFFFEINNVLAISVEKQNDIFTLDLQSWYDISIEMAFGNMFLMVSWWSNLSLEKDFHYDGVC